MFWVIHPTIRPLSHSATTASWAALGSASWSGFTGSSTLYFVVDPSDGVAEENEADNVDSLASLPARKQRPTCVFRLDKLNKLLKRLAGLFDSPIVA